jgi:hypothetical protein
MYCTLQNVDRVKWLERAALQPNIEFFKKIFTFG